MHETTGRKEDIAQAVVVAALTSLVTGLVNWGVDEVKRAIEKRRERKPDLQKQDEGKAE